MHTLSPDPWLAPVLAVWLAGGLLLGLVYFTLLRRSAELLVAGAGLRGAGGLVALRLFLMIGLLTAAALSGTGPLLATALGFWVGRSLVMRRQRRGNR